MRLRTAILGMTRLIIKKNYKTILAKNKHFLYPYQEIGVQWLKKKEKTQKGGLLCDEMGLGKTIQIICLLISNSLDRTLILMPKSLINQWESEIKKFSGDYFNVLVHHGLNRITEESLEKVSKPTIVLSTYGLVINRSVQSCCNTCGESISIVKNKCGHRFCPECESECICSNCFSEIDNPLLNINWDRVILEECHIIRNKKSKMFKYVNKLKSNIRWGITGTPVHNSIKDFISLCNFLRVSNDINSKNLDKIVSKVLIRRTKKEVLLYNQNLKIPNLEIEIHKVMFNSEKELNFYKKVKGDIKKELSILKQFDDFNMVKILEMILRLRQACIMPQLVINGYQKKWNIDYPKWTGTNSKLDKLIKHIKTERCIVFYTYKEEMKYISKSLKDEHINLGIIDGSKSIEQRTVLIEKCQIDNSNNKDVVQILLIQINAGGTGLNLQMFSNVWFTSPSWNPSLEFQAIARCHRIGQKNNVKVKKLIMFNKLGTIDERIIDVQERKKEIISKVLPNNDFPPQKYKLSMRNAKSLLR